MLGLKLNLSKRGPWCVRANYLDRQCVWLEFQIQNISFKQRHLEMLSVQFMPFCQTANELNICVTTITYSLYNMSRKICTRFCCVLYCYCYCYIIISWGFMWCISPYPSGLIPWQSPLEHSYCLSTCEVTLKDINDIDRHQTTIKQNKIMNEFHNAWKGVEWYFAHYRPSYVMRSSIQKGHLKQLF